MYDKTFSDRLDFVVEKIGGAVKACQLANITHPTLMRWKDGTSDPKVSNLLAFAQAGGVSLDWLIAGVESSIIQTEAGQIDNNDEYEYIPYADNVFASAGGGRFNDGVVSTDSFLAFRKDWLQSNGFKTKDLVAINTDGDSMLPTIPENATVVVDKSKNAAKDGRIYVVCIDDQLYVKRVQWLPTGLRLISDNKDIYNPIDLSKADLNSSHIQIYGQVVHISYDLPH